MKTKMINMGNWTLHLVSKAQALVALIGFTLQVSVFSLTACSPEPPLHLYESQPNETQLVFAELELDTYWDYEIEFGVRYDWRAEWYYGWDDEDVRIFGEIGYTLPNEFNIRRYFTADVPYAPHTRVQHHSIVGTVFQGEFTYGFWDMLVFNDVQIKEGAQSLIFDEQTTLDSITVYTNQSMRPARYSTPRHQHSYYQPEELYAAYEQAIDINRNLDGFVYDPERNVWVKKLSMILRPITYIYLTQVIIHHNNGKVVGVDGSGNLSGMARWSVLNSGRAGDDDITVNFNTRWKTNCDREGENVDIAGGRLLTFGICEQAGNKIRSYKEVRDTRRHYFDLNMQFNNGMDSTFVFDVTDQVRKRYKGGVLTVELDMDTISVPTRSGGSAFNAVVQDYVEVEPYEFPM
ncbi:MAG: DUF5119 domain-containing protein [Prevotella sp.]|nr:DUF5119 domain-containing protein [Prevotella sp.]